MGGRRLFTRLGVVCCVVACCGGASVDRARTGIDAARGDDLAFRTEESYEAARRWFLEALRPEGWFHYQYDPRKDRYSGRNNAIRQLMASRLLAEMAAENRELLPDHRRNLEFVVAHWYRERGDDAYVFFDRKSKLGANAMLLRTLVWSPFFDEHRDEARKLANGILSLTTADGAMRAWYIAPTYHYDEDYLLTFYSGEAILALVEYAEKTGEAAVMAAAKRSAAFYLRLYVDEMEANYYPAYVPWHTLALDRLFRLTGEARYADAVFVMNDRLLGLLDTTDYVGRFYNPSTPQFGKPHGSSDAVYTEGLAAAYGLALEVEDSARAARYFEALELAVGNLASLQYGPAEARRVARPDRVLGGIRISVTRPEIRIDTVQHALDAFRKLLGILDHDGGRVTARL